jgi:DNA-binding transcriptional MerR regulator
MKPEELGNIVYRPRWLWDELKAFAKADSKLKEQLNNQQYSLQSAVISSRVLNHWYENGIIDDNRANGKGWKKFSISEIIWIHIVLKLRKFGLNLEKIKDAKGCLDNFNTETNISKCVLLDYFIGFILHSNEPIKLLVFESGYADISPQLEIDLSTFADLIQDDYISIDLNKLVFKFLNKKDIKVDYLGYNHIPKSPLIKQIEESLTANDIQSISIRVKDKDYIIDEEFFVKDRTKANALMSVLKFGKLVENKDNGKSTFQVTDRKKVNK